MCSSTSAWLTVSGRSTRIEVIPTSAQSLCLPLTYHRDPGSSPTSTVPRPGTTPCSRSLATRSASSALIALAVRLPSRVCAVTVVILASTSRKGVVVGGSVEEVPGTGDVHGHAGRGEGVHHVLVALGAAGLDDRGDPGVDEDLRAVGEREERVGGRDRAGRPVPGPLDREPAGVDPVHLAHAHADRGAVGGQ